MRFGPLPPSFQNTYSLAFDGVDDRVQLTSDFTASAEFTISFWMKPTTISGNGNHYVMGTFPNNENFINLDQIKVIQLRIGLTTLIFSESYLGSLNNILVLNEWQNITFIRDSSNVIRCYRNGTSFGNPSTPPTNSNTLTLNSFGRIITNTFGFNGGLDEIAFWNTDETSNVTEIGGGIPTDLTILNPLAWYRMGEKATYDGTNWTLVDQGSGGNDATSVNMDLIDRVEDTPPTP